MMGHKPLLIIKLWIAWNWGIMIISSSQLMYEKQSKSVDYLLHSASMPTHPGVSGYRLSLLVSCTSHQISWTWGKVLKVCFSYYFVTTAFAKEN